MRVLRVLPAIPALALASLSGHAQRLTLNISPAQLIREVVYNELHDHQQHGYWRYWIERHTSSGDIREEQVETASGPVTMVEEGNGQQLSGPARQQEFKKMQNLLNSPAEQARHLKEYRQDEDRIGHIVALLPEAFLFDFDGVDDGCYRFRFRPNPAYQAHSVEARVLHAMTGTIWINARYTRLARLDGRIEHNVDFGYGLLGRIYKGGWFQLERVRVNATDWKTDRLEVHMNIRALLVTTIARETSERRGGFTPVPSTITLAEGVAMLEHLPPSVPASDSALARTPVNPAR